MLTGLAVRTRVVPLLAIASTLGRPSSPGPRNGSLRSPVPVLRQSTGPSSPGPRNGSLRSPVPVLRQSTGQWPMRLLSALGYDNFSRRSTMTFHMLPLYTVTTSPPSTSPPTPFIIVARSISRSIYTLCVSRWLSAASVLCTFPPLSSLPMS